MIDHDSNSVEAGISFVIFDNNYTLLQDNVRPEDRDEFGPLLDALVLR